MAWLIRNIEKLSRLCVSTKFARTSYYSQRAESKELTLPALRAQEATRHFFRKSAFSCNRQLSRDLLNRTGSRFCRAAGALNVVAPPSFTGPPRTPQSLDVHLDISGSVPKTVVRSVVAQTLTLCYISHHYRTKAQILMDGSTARDSTQQLNVGI